MATGLRNENRKKILDWAATHPEIKEVYLYGSRARGDHRPGSDIDLAITINQGSNDGNAWATWIYWRQAFEENPDLTLSSEIHLEWLDEEDPMDRVGPGVERDGIKIYPQT